MAEDTKQLAIFMTGMVVLVVFSIFGGIKCEGERGSRVVECIKAGHTPAECAQAMPKGSQ